MKRGAITSVIAFCLAVIFALLPQAQFVQSDFTSDSLLSSSDKDIVKTEIADVAYLNDNTPKKTDLSVSSESADYTVDSDGIPGGSTAVNPDEILPDSSAGSTVEDVEQIPEKTETAGTTIIPVKINNIIRDNLPSSISTNTYTFSADERGAIIFAFNHTDTENSRDCIWYITLYEEYSPDGMGDSYDYRELERISYTTVGESKKSGTIGISPGDYRISVECISGYTSEKYDLAIGFAQADDYEIEPNNAKTRYTWLSLDKTINGSASSTSGDNDEDWYMFEVTETGYAVLYFEHEADAAASSASTVAWRICITDMQGNEYFYTASGMEKAAVNSGVMGLEKGYYFVTVYSHVYSSVSYALNVSFTKDSSIEKEFNDTMSTATPVSVNTEIVGSLTERNNISDRDYYSFTMENDGFIIIDFLHEALPDEKEGWHISVVSEDGKIAYNSVSDWSQPIHQSPNIGISAGKYYILIDSDNIYHSNIVYRLILLTVQDGTWESEPNNTTDDADIITIGKAINGTMIENGVDYDKDYFKVDISSSGTLQVDFSHTVSNSESKEGWVISIVDADGNELSSTSADWDSDTVTFTAAVESGSYYILVETGLYYTGDRYSITTTFG